MATLGTNRIWGAVVVVGALAHYLHVRRLAKQLAECEAKAETLRELREQERAGRTKREREANQQLQRAQDAAGYNMRAIGHVASCFPDRRGTARR
jgi:hypothetical protein